MAMSDEIFSNRMLRMSCGFESEGIALLAARVKEGLSQITESTVEFVCRNRALNLETVVGQTVTVSMVKNEKSEEREFHGTIVSAEYLGLYQGFGLFTAEVRPWTWFLTRVKENRIFQNQTAPEIIQAILSDYGYTSDLEKKTSTTYPAREYCVQYRETDYDFICRLMEEEGMYFFFTHDQGKEKMVLADGLSAHKPVPGNPQIKFNYREVNLLQTEFRKRQDHIYDWTANEQVVTGKVSLDDYDFEKPKAAMLSDMTDPKGRHSHTGFEHYSYPGRYRETSVGDRYAKVRLQSVEAPFTRWQGLGNVRTMAVGQTFKLENHPRVDDQTEYLIVSATHLMQIETDYEDAETKTRLLGERIDYSGNDDTYRCLFQVQPKTTPFRAPQSTAWPEIPGMQTAVVVGPSGEEIHTDKYGRIKVQFHWDRLGKPNDTASCWVRTVMPWTGKNWGMVAVPRIGQEVAIMFEEGDPDRPICTGMLYNADTMPPYGLPGNMTQTGIKTNSSKGGGGFNELVMEDKKGEEFVRLQSEKDYKEIIKNNAEITIGLEKKDSGDLTQTVHRHKTETLNTGDMTFTVSEGNEIRSIATDQTEDIGNNRTQSIGSDSSVTIGSNSTLSVGSNLSETIGSNQTTDVGSNLTVDVGSNIKEKAGQKITIEAGMEILLKVGGSSIKINNLGVTITGKMVQVKGGVATEVKGGVSLILKGGMTMIN